MKKVRRNAYVALAGAITADQCLGDVGDVAQRWRSDMVGPQRTLS